MTDQPKPNAKKALARLKAYRTRNYRHRHGGDRAQKRFFRFDDEVGLDGF